MTAPQWTAVVQGVLTILLMVAGTFFARARAEQVGRDELLKSLQELREQISDRDRTALGLREELKSMNERLRALGERVQAQETQILALVAENLALKRLEANAHPQPFPPRNKSS